MTSLEKIIGAGKIVFAGEKRADFYNPTNLIARMRSGNGGKDDKRREKLTINRIGRCGFFVYKVLGILRLWRSVAVPRLRSGQNWGFTF